MIKPKSTQRNNRYCSTDRGSENFAKSPPVSRTEWTFAGSVVLLLCGLLANALAQDAPRDRTRWENKHMVGSPEPPSPYMVERTFTNIEWKAPIYIAPEPGTDTLWVALQGGDKLGPSRIVRIQD